MGFEARGDSIKGILSSNRTYTIPRFQREFSWEESNYNDFFLDILKQITFKDENYETHQYYFGNMLFLGDKEDEYVDVIDGQQRLTTITICLSALRDILFSLKNESANNYAKTIQNEYIAKKLDGNLVKRLKTDSSFPYFSQKIQAKDDSEFMEKPKTEEEQGIERAYNFFKKKFELQSLITTTTHHTPQQKLEEQYYLDFLKAFRDQLLGSEIITVFIDDKSQANQIFENINSKGKPLNPIDLIKNYIFSKIPFGENDIEDNLKLKWRTISNKIDKSKNIGGFNVYFLHFWKAKYPSDSANGSNLYKKFLTRFSSAEEKKLIELIIELEAYLDIYIKISEVPSDNFLKQEQKSEQEYLTALKYFNATQVRVPLLALYKVNFKLKSEQKKNILKFLSYFHFIAFGTSVTFRSNLLTSPFKEFTIGIVNSKNSADLSNCFNDFKARVVRLIKKDEIRNAFISLKYEKKSSEGNYSQYPTKFILDEIAKHYDNLTYRNSHGSIEHIFDEADSPLNTSIGNLLILENTINKKLGDLKNCQKNINKIEYYQKSQLNMVKDFVKKHSSLDSLNISDRSSELFTYFWDNLWSPFIENPSILKGQWENEDGSVQFVIEDHTIEYNNHSYTTLFFTQQKEIYTIVWDEDKIDIKGNPQPFIFKYLKDSDEIDGDFKYHRVSNKKL